MSNNNLINAKKAKNDEFYTQLSDIEKELSHYPIETFKDKVVYCPCDSTDYSNGYISNFAIYFYKNFKSLGLKKLICTCYSDGINYYEYNGINEFESHSGSGDFRSEYCTKLLQEADIVVTNPPFSLFREFMAWLEPEKGETKFIVVGNQNAITYKEVFSLIKDNKLWAGNGGNITCIFRSTNPNTLDSNRDYVIKKGFNPDEGYIKVPAISWFTNCDYNKRHEELILVESYDSEKYPKYDNYDAIEVSKVNEIPKDYNGVMGVPITFLYKYNPDQFEIVGLAAGNSNKDKLYGDVYHVVMKGDKGGAGLINGKVIYARILIRHRKDENDLSSDT